MPASQNPYALALIVCESVHRHPQTGQHTILGTINKFKARQFPSPARFSVYFALTDGSGPVNLGLKIVDSESLGADDSGKEENSRLPETQVEVNIPDPFSTIEGVISLQMVFPKEGVYFCQLFAGDGNLLMERRITVAAASAERS